MIDYHTHSIYSDGRSTYLEILNEAQNKGVVELGFSDHLCLHYPDWAIKKDDFNEVKNEIIGLQQESKFNTNIRFGFEVDYLIGKESYIQKLISQFPLDYVIGSIHYVDGWNFDTSTKDYDKKDINQFYIDYFDLLIKAANSRLFDIIGHADVVKKFNFKPEIDLDILYEKSAVAFNNSNVVVELNTSGRDRPCSEFYPSESFLRHCYTNNVPVTLGSDAHIASEVTRYFHEAIQLLKNIGYRKVAIFKNRKRSYVQL